VSGIAPHRECLIRDICAEWERRRKSSSRNPTVADPWRIGWGEKKNWGIHERCFLYMGSALIRSDVSGNRYIRFRGAEGKLAIHRQTLKKKSAGGDASYQKWRNACHHRPIERGSKMAVPVELGRKTNTREGGGENRLPGRIRDSTACRHKGGQMGGNLWSKSGK